jgi:hypothetical protein
MKTIAIKKSVYDQLMAVSKWYAAYPSHTNFAAGDRFHENVAEFQHACFDDPAELTDTQYFSHVELDGDKFIVAYGGDEALNKDDEALYTYYEVVAK